MRFCTLFQIYLGLEKVTSAQIKLMLGKYLSVLQKEFLKLALFLKGSVFQIFPDLELLEQPVSSPAIRWIFLDIIIFR